MRPNLVFLLLLLLCSTSQTIAQKPTQYATIKVFLDAEEHNLLRLGLTGVPVDHGEYKLNSFFISDFSASEIDAIKKAGFQTKVLIKDAVKHYADRNSASLHEKLTAAGACNSIPAILPAHFRLGSYGGHFTYTEMLSILDSMQTLYPSIISVKQAIDTFRTTEGRPIYMVKISNRPTVYDSLRPQALYTAVHHAREPGSLTALIFYMWYLLENYSTDAHIKSIVDNTELYFIPCLNPDGYEYNIATNPSGGGLWRKNRRDNGDGTAGVDLNRNYAHFWAFDDFGSSPFTSSDVYRGPSAFSEPETQAIKWLSEQRRFLYNLNYHSFGNHVIYPWGYVGSLLTPDSTQFQECGAYLTEGIPYRYGTGDQTVGYVTNGDSNDWMYGEQTTKNKILSFTPEIGPQSSGFYPPISDIIPDCQTNLITCLHTANLLLPFVKVTTNDQKVITANSGYLHYNVQRLGYTDTTYTVSLTSLDSRLTIATTPRVYSRLTLLQQFTDSVSYTIAAGTLNGQQLSYVRAVNNSFYTTYDTVRFYYSNYYNNIIPSTNSLTDWTAVGWDTCSAIFRSSPAAIGSSATGCDNYRDSTIATLQYNRTIDLTRAKKAYLYFWAKWGIEANYDYAAVQVSPTGSGFWQPLCGRYTKGGSIFQNSLPAIYDGQQYSWVQEEMDLSDYLGQTIDLQFVMVADEAVRYSGFFIDDVNLIAINDTNTGVQSLHGTTPQMSVFPNPAHNTITLHVSGYSFNSHFTAAIYDNLGRLVLQAPISQAQTDIDISNLAPGLYYLKAEGSDVAIPVTNVVVSK